MKNQPWIPLLGGLALLQVLLVFLIYWPRAGSESAPGPLFPTLAANEVRALTIADGATEAELTLARDDGGAWILPGAGDFPVREESVQRLLDGIAGLSGERLVARTPASYGRLQVADDEFVRRVTLEMADGERHTLFIGSSPQMRSVHVRAGGQEEVYLARDLSVNDAGTQVSSWIDTLYFSVDQEQIQRIILENAKGTFAFYREADEWTMEGLDEGESFNPGNFTSLLSTLSSLAMVAPLGKEPQPAYGLEEPTAEVTVVYAQDGEEKSATLRIGALDGETNRYVVDSSESPYLVEAAAYTVAPFVERGRGDFLLQPEAGEVPGPDGAATPVTTPAGEP